MKHSEIGHPPHWFLMADLSKPLPGKSSQADIPNYSALSRKDFEDYEFILAELLKMAKLSFPQELKGHLEEHPEDGLVHLYHPKDSRLLLFTREGTRRFWQIARRGLRTLGSNARRYDRRDVVKKLQATFLRAYFEDSKAINDENSYDIFLRAIAESSQGFVEITHWIPCDLVSQTSPAHFYIGPCEFELSSVFWENHGQAIVENLKSASRHEAVRQFFTSHQWVASIRVPPCGPNTSETRAVETLQHCLDLFKLFVGSSRAGRVRHAYVPGLQRYTSKVYSVDVEFHVAETWAMRNAVVKDDWLGDVAEFIPWVFAEHLIRKQLGSWEALPDPEQRLLDGLAWHSDGVSELRAAAQLLKYWTAIERIVGGSNIKERAAILSAGQREFPAQFKKCQSLYTRRSEIAHGTYRGGHERLELSAREAEIISQSVITSYALIAAKLNRNGHLTPEGIAAEFKRFDEIARAHR